MIHCQERHTWINFKYDTTWWTRGMYSFNVFEFRNKIVPLDR